MSTLATHTRRLIDAAEGLELRGEHDSVLTETTVTTPVALSQLSNAYWHDDSLPFRRGTILLHVSEVDNSGDHRYLFSVQVDDTADHSDNPTTIAADIKVVAPGTYEITFDASTGLKLDPDSGGGEKWLALRCELSGADPSINFSARLLPG